jgi:hypothetical protein
VRQRANQVRLSGQHVQRMQKALELMNLKLTPVLGDVTGVSGLAIIRAIVAGDASHVVASVGASRLLLLRDEVGLVALVEEDHAVQLVPFQNGPAATLSGVHLVVALPAELHRGRGSWATS